MFSLSAVTVRETTVQGADQGLQWEAETEETISVAGDLKTNRKLYKTLWQVVVTVEFQCWVYHDHWSHEHWNLMEVKWIHHNLQVAEGSPTNGKHSLLGKRSMAESWSTKPKSTPAPTSEVFFKVCFGKNYIFGHKPKIQILCQLLTNRIPRVRPQQSAAAVQPPLVWTGWWRFQEARLLPSAWSALVASSRSLAKSVPCAWRGAATVWGGGARRRWGSTTSSRGWGRNWPRGNWRQWSLAALQVEGALGFYITPGNPQKNVFKSCKGGNGFGSQNSSSTKNGLWPSKIWELPQRWVNCFDGFPCDQFLILW